jgi:hypothetical protein
MRRCAICPTMSGMIERQSCALAERMSNINTKRTMLSLAEDYDKFSDRAAERAGGRRAWVSPSIRLIRRQAVICFRQSRGVLSRVARPRTSTTREHGGAVLSRPEVTRFGIYVIPCHFCT